MVKIVNPGPEDYHMHTSTFSDGTNSFDEIVQLAGKFGLKKIVITDHSQIGIESVDLWKKNTSRSHVPRLKNVHNDVKVSFGMEIDLLDEKGNICSHIQGHEAGEFGDDFTILSAHPEVYKGDKNKVTESYIKAIEKHHKRIKLIGHPCATYFSKYVDIEKVVKIANKYEIPLEVDGANILNHKTDLKLLRKMLKIADKVYVNSDAHTSYELKEARNAAFKFLKEEGYM